jgi:hypothetical protein
MKTYGGVDVQIQINALLTLAPVRGEWSTSRPGSFTLGKSNPGTQWIGTVRRNKNSRPYCDLNSDRSLRRPDFI